MKLRRDISGNDLIKFLMKYDYVISRQTGSHIRLSKKNDAETFHLTIPNHNPIKIGTLSSILTEISYQLKIDKLQLIESLNKL